MRTDMFIIKIFSFHNNCNLQVNLQLFKEHVDSPIIAISAKMGSNISTLLKEIRMLYDNFEADISTEEKH